ncbi:LLM class flavin-dependent oxidoreductase [Nocardia sp. BSTN01]|uniref:LLM class flavin-dependent oxidoreductase n=1 Tax=Nocardia sp. BSTN01 TaxID=2783665 RepID=UPI00188E8A23|nr:LLM class flavin-dependent oxidoreductase [Nocardia sp. BSTN01]MBF4997671.1 LLM class flavin-dependent oxidoreductase [Nocardia sp. BSTN01]
MSDSVGRAPSFGIKTTPAHVGYADILRVWLEADDIPEIEHAWLYDHLLPRAAVGLPGHDGSDSAGSRSAGPVLEGWTSLAALAARTRRLRLGLLVSNNRIRHPALLAKMAATVDVISGGRLDFGIGVGGFPRNDPRFETMVAPEYAAYGIPVGTWRDAVSSLAEACVLIRRMWTEEVFDFPGERFPLTGAQCDPKPVQRPHPPILLAGAGASTLPIVAAHADLWNVIGPPLTGVDTLRQHSRALDEHCAAIGRDPAHITRSAQLPISYDAPGRIRETLLELIDAGFTHLVLNPPAPYPDGVAHWLADEIIRPTLDAAAR